MIEPYLFYEGCCEDAIAFYKKALGAEVKMLMRYSESPEPCPEGRLPPGNENKIMHAELTIRDMRVMVSDGLCSGQPRFGGFALSIPAKDVDESQRLFNDLSEGGEVRMPLGPTFYSPSFGMVADRFGLLWMIIVQQ